jgi:hypothetical protein
MVWFHPTCSMHQYLDGNIVIGVHIWQGIFASVIVLYVLYDHNYADSVLCIACIR